MSITSVGTGVSVLANQPDYSLAQSVQSQLGASLDSTAPSVTILSTDARADNLAAVATFVKAYGMPLQMGQDASHAMEALESTMQSVIQQRPDLANATFDFQSDNGHIKVMSSTMSAKDMAWLEGQLNSNKALSAAVQSFHDHAVEGYQLWASLDGSAATSDPAAISAAADKKFSFMDVFHRFSQAFVRGMDRSGTFSTLEGKPIDFDLSPTTAQSLLSFANAAKAVKQGSVLYVDPAGGSHYGVLKGDIFGSLYALPDFRPPNDHNTLGLSAKA